MNDITAVLLNLPAHASRELLNRIESADECEPIFKIEIKPVKIARPTRRQVKKAVKKVAKHKRRS